MSEQDKDRRIQELEERVSQLSKMLVKSFNYAQQDPDTFLQNARKTTEAICRFIYTRHIGEPKKKMMLNDFARELKNQKIVSDRILILVGTIQTYGNYGSHVQEDQEEVTRDWIAPCQTALANLTNWFFTEYLKGEVPMPEELAAPVHDHASEEKQKAAEKAERESGSPNKSTVWVLVIAGFMLLAFLTYQQFFKDDSSVAKQSVENESQPPAQPETPVAKDSDEEAKAANESVEKLNERTAPVPGAKRLAVLYFDNSSENDELDQLRKGLAGMMITDLSQVRMLNVVERDKLEAILEEQELSNTEEFDASTAAKVGKLLGAESILTGSYFEMFGKLRIDARIIDVETGSVQRSEGVEGKKDDFFGLEKELVGKIVQDLDIKISDKDEQAMNRAKDAGISYETSLMFSKGIELVDQRKQKAAVELFQKVLEEAPDFEPAQVELKRLNSSVS